MYEGDLAGAERLALTAIESRVAHPEVVEPLRLAEIAMSVVTMVRGELEASLAWSEQVIDAGRADDDLNLGFGLFYASVALSTLGRTDEALSLIEQLEGYYRRHPFGGAGFYLNHALGLIHKDANPDQARRHFQLALDAGRAVGSPMMIRIATGGVMSLVIAHAPLAEAAAAAHEVIEAMWDGRFSGNVRRYVAPSVVICSSAGRYHDAAQIDGWLGEGGHGMTPGDLDRFQHALADIDAHLGDNAAHLRAQGAQWEPATAIEHILTTLRAISQTRAESLPD